MPQITLTDGADRIAINAAVNPGNDTIHGLGGDDYMFGGFGRSWIPAASARSARAAPTR